MDQLDPRLLAALLGQGAGGGGGGPRLPPLPHSADGPDSRKKAQIEAQIRNSPNELFKTIHQWQIANVRFENTARVDTIRNLLDDPALRRDINVVDSEDCSVLFYSMQSRQHKASRLLIEAGADVFGTVEHSPLRLLFFGMKGPVGSNTMLFTKWLFSHLEAQGKKQEAVECLSRHPCPLLVLSMKKREQLLAIELLLQLGVSPAISHAGGWTALHHACKKGHVGLTRLLLAHGADINAVKNDGYTPLHLAAFNGHCEVVELLLMAGAMTQPLTGESEERPVLSRKTAADLADIDNHPYAAYIIRTWDYWHTPTVQPIPDNDDVMTDSHVVA